MNDILCLLTTLNILDRLLKILLILLNNQVCIIDWNVMDTGSTNEMTSSGIMTTTSDASRDDENYMHASRDENKHYVKKQTPEEVQEDNSEYDQRVATDEKKRKASKCRVKKYDVIIGSDLVYCQSDTQGILKVISTYLSEKGIFIIVVPKPSHRYGTEFLVPVLQTNGFEVYSRCIAHSTCTSSEVMAADGSVDEKYWKYSGIEEKRKNHIEEIDDSLLPFLDDLQIDNDWLVSGLDEHPFVAWNLIIGRRK